MFNPTMTEEEAEAQRQLEELARIAAAEMYAQADPPPPSTTGNDFLSPESQAQRNDLGPLSVVPGKVPPIPAQAPTLPDLISQELPQAPAEVQNQVVKSAVPDLLSPELQREANQRAAREALLKRGPMSRETENTTYGILNQSFGNPAAPLSQEPAHMTKTPAADLAAPATGAAPTADAEQSSTTKVDPRRAEYDADMRRADEYDAYVKALEAEDVRDAKVDSDLREGLLRAGNEEREGADYNGWKALRDLAPTVLGGLLAGTMSNRRNRGNAMGQVAAAGIGQIQQNTDRDMKQRENARGFMLDANRQMNQLGSTALGRKMKKAELIAEGQRIRTNARNSFSTAELRDQQKASTTLDIAKKQVDLDASDGASAFSKDAWKRANVIRARNGAPLIPEGTPFNEFKDDPTFKNEGELAYQQQLTSEMTRRAAGTASASENARSDAAASNAPQDANTNRIVNAGGARGTREGTSANRVLQPGQRITDDGLFARANESEGSVEKYRNVSAAAKAGQAALRRMEELDRKHPQGIDSRIPSHAADAAEYESHRNTYITSDVILGNGGVVNQGEVDLRIKEADADGLTAWRNRRAKRTSGTLRGFRAKANSALDSYGTALDDEDEPGKPRTAPRAPSVPNKQKTGGTTVIQTPNGPAHITQEQYDILKRAGKVK